MLIAALWGFAEATIIFVVVDVWLTWIAATRGPFPALKASLTAAVAAAAGGAIMWWVGAAMPETARAFLDSLPSISPQMLDDAATGLREPDWVAPMIEGSLTGVPYKVFAAEAGAAGIPLPAFAAMSVPVRLLRFTLAVLAASAAAFLLRKAAGERWVAPVWTLFWVGFYGLYWSVMPG